MTKCQKQKTEKQNSVFVSQIRGTRQPQQNFSVAQRDESQSETESETKPEPGTPKTLWPRAKRTVPITSACAVKTLHLMRIKYEILFMNISIQISTTFFTFANIVRV